MTNRTRLDALFRKHGFADFKWIDPQTIVVAQWVRMKCRFGCNEYGRNACCPPNTPSVDACRCFFREYAEGVLFHFAKRVDHPEDRHAWLTRINEQLLRLERAVFLAGHPKTFLLFAGSCSFCPECARERVACQNKRSARPTVEAMAVDVYSTVTQLGYPIDVLRDYTDAMNRYALLLVR